VASARKAIMTGVAADGAIAAVKLLGGTLTGSAVMIAEAIHSLVDGANALLLLLGERRSQRPATSRHPFGHGKEVYFWTVVVAMVTLVVGGCLAALEGVLGWRAHAPRRVWIDFAILGAALVFNGASLFVAVRELYRYQRETGYRGSLYDVIRQSHNPPIFFAVVWDMASIGGILIAAAALGLATLLHAPRIDAAGSILDGILLVFIAGLLGWETRSLIVGEAAGQPLVDDARRTIAAERGLGSVGRIESLQLGPGAVMLVVHAEPDDALGAAELARTARALERRLRAAHPSIQHLVFDFG
jgi:cation diffusion facilitator family transporter